MPTFEKELQAFIFFHLGSDAQLELQQVEQEFQVSLSHQRIHDFSFRLPLEEATRLANAPLEFEEFLLNLLTRHRRSRS